MITTVTTTTTTTATIATSLQIFVGGLVTVVTLIILLALREILGADEGGTPFFSRFVKTSGIICIPLLFAFIAIVICKITLIL